MLENGRIHLKIFATALIFSTSSMFGCAKAAQTSSGEVRSSNVVPHKTFQESQKSAEKFIGLWRQSKASRASGKYKEALGFMEEAYNKEAFGRVEKSIALEDMAMTYEAMKDYELAANFYEGAAKTTMNPDQAKEFNKKSSELRAKLN